MTWIPSRFLVSANARPRDAPHWGNGGGFHYNCHLQTYLNFRVEHLWFAARLLFSLVRRSYHRRSRCGLLISFVVTIIFYRWTCQLACSVFFFFYFAYYISVQNYYLIKTERSNLCKDLFFFFSGRFYNQLRHCMSPNCSLWSLCINFTSITLIIGGLSIAPFKNLPHVVIYTKEYHFRVTKHSCHEVR